MKNFIQRIYEGSINQIHKIATQEGTVNGVAQAMRAGQIKDSTILPETSQERLTRLFRDV